MMHKAACLLALFPWAMPVAAGCFTAEGLPDRAVYDTGTTLEYVGLSDGILTYRSKGMTSRTINGLLPLDHRAKRLVVDYHWEGEAPTFERLQASGTLVITGKRQTDQKATQEVRAELTFLGEEKIDWEDCRYSVIRFRRVITLAGKIESDATLTMAPGPQISFKSESRDIKSGETYSYALKSLE